MQDLMISEIMARMGDIATEREAQCMADVLQERGYTLRQEPGLGLTITPEPTSTEWEEMTREALRRAAEAEPHAWRAAIYVAPDGSEMPMTLPEESARTDEELIALAVREARSAGLIGPHEHQVTEAVFRSRLRIGTWAGKGQ